jgi:hypothetical protein
MAIYLSNDIANLGNGGQVMGKYEEQWSWERTDLECWNNETRKYDKPSGSIWLKGPLGMHEVMDVTDGYAEVIVKALNDAPKLAERVEELEKANGEMAHVVCKLAEQNEKMLAMLKRCSKWMNERMQDVEPHADINVPIDTYDLIADIETK